MKEKIKQMLKDWAQTNNNHPIDKNRFYEIVFLTLEEKIEEIDYYDIVPKDSTWTYSKYEDLRDFGRYIEEKNKK